ncbi:MAG TPA: Ig-like domain-containing protein, partial [Planctomycetota bacterium]
YTIDDYTAELPAPETLQQTYPLGIQTYDTDPSASDTMAYAANANVWVDAQTTPFQLHAAIFDVDAQDNARYVADGWTTVRNDVPPGVMQLDIQIGLHGFVLRQGHRIRMAIETQVWHRPASSPALSNYRALPVFEDFNLEVLRDGAHPSYVRILYVPFGPPTLVASEVEVPRSNGPRMSLSVKSDSSRAGWTYTVLFGGSGTSPGSTFDGVFVDLNQDAWTDFFLLNPNAGPAENFQGTLDGSGAATPVFDLIDIDPLPEEIGTLSFAVVIQSPNGSIVQATNAVEIQIEADPVLLGSLTLAPFRYHASLGEQVQMSAIGDFDNGSVADLTNEVAWFSKKKNVATIDANGLVTVRGYGQTTITATMDGVVKKTAFFVDP